GTSKSCGCKRLKHGHTSGGVTPTYQSWKAMKARCNNSHIKSHGGRGIRYDPRWEEFPAFLKDMRERPEGMTSTGSTSWATTVKRTADGPLLRCKRTTGGIPNCCTTTTRIGGQGVSSRMGAIPSAKAG